MPLMKINDIDMYYEITGEGFPVVLIHGVTISHILWDLQVPEFSKHFKVINLDLRNHGETTKLDMDITMELLADDVKALLDKLNIDEAFIIGESMGCFVSMEFAIKYPKITKALVLTCGANSDNTLIGPKMVIDSWIEHYEKGPEIFIEKDLPLIACKKCRNMEEAEELFKKFNKLLMSNPKNIIIQVFKGIQKFNVKNRLNQIESPTLIVHGKRDKLIPLLFVNEVHNLIKNSKLEILDGCHFVLIHSYKKYNEVILNFLTAIEGK